MSIIFFYLTKASEDEFEAKNQRYPFYGVSATRGYDSAGLPVPLFHLHHTFVDLQASSAGH